MDKDSTGASQGHHPRAVRTLVKVVLGVLFTVGFIAALFWLAGGPGWWPGWAYVGLLTLGQSVVALLLRRRDPELLERRASVGEGTEKWDQVVLGLFGLTYLAVVVMGAVDGGRFHWAPMASWLWGVGAVLYVLGTALVTWAMLVNTHFEKTVRIQRDRGHEVIDSGPYRFVRHPGYVGAALAFPLATPFLLGSAWAFVPAAASVASLVVRTALEDRTLARELEGYAAYTRRTRFRLVPGLW